MAALVAAMIAVPGAALGQQPKPPVKPSAAAGSEASKKAPELSELARQLLRRRMERHGKELSQLLMAVVLLRREVVEPLARDVAAEPRIVRPLPGDQDELNAALPERFFVLQDELRARAKELAEASKTKKDKELAEALARLTQVCVSCHSAFLEPRRDEAP
jgi:hypothetical protein